MSDVIGSPTSTSTHTLATSPDSSATEGASTSDGVDISSTQTLATSSTDSSDEMIESDSSEDDDSDILTYTLVTIGLVIVSLLSVIVVILLRKDVNLCSPKPSNTDTDTDPGYMGLSSTNTGEKQEYDVLACSQRMDINKQSDVNVTENTHDEQAATSYEDREIYEEIV